MNCTMCNGLVIPTSDVYGTYGTCLRCGQDYDLGHPTAVPQESLVWIMREPPAPLYFSFTDNIGRKVEAHAGAA